MVNKETRNYKWDDLGIPNKLIKTVMRMGFKFPTPIQQRALPVVFKRKNIFAIAPAGTGKTLCYLLPISHILNLADVKAVILMPTRELAYQASQMLQALDPDIHKFCQVIIGGANLSRQQRRLNTNWRILIATPGRLLDFIELNRLILKDIRIAVIDEFDKLLRLGFEEQLRKILEHIPGSSQKMWFSATAPDSETKVVEKRSTIWIDITNPKKTGSCTEKFYFLKTSKTKNALCYDALKNLEGQAIVFVKNREKTHHLNGFLKLKGLNSKALHGKMKQTIRTKTYQEFMDGKFSILAATDIAARGLDTLNVDLVINYDLPVKAAEYIHRKGRAGRKGRKGHCITYAGPEDYIQMRNLEQELKYPLPCEPGYALKEKWYAAAGAAHRKKFHREERIQEIKKAQGLKDHTSSIDAI